MQTHIEPTLDHIQADIDSLSQQNNHLLHLIFKIERYITANSCVESFYAELNHHLNQLKTLTENQAEADRIGILNDYFFNKMNFEIIEKDGYEKLPHWQLNTVISQCRSTGFMGRILYMHMARELGISLNASEHSHLCLVTWLCNSEEIYLNLNLKAKRLSQQEVVLCFNQRSIGSTQKACLDTLSDHDLLKTYLNNMMTFFNKFNHPKLYLKLLNIYLILDKNHLHSLSERALLYKELGHTNKAYNDLKRYMSFTDHNSTPKNIKLTYYELQAIHKERVDLLLKQETHTLH